MKIESFNIQDYLKRKTDIEEYQKAAHSEVETLATNFKSVLSDYKKPDYLTRVSGFMRENVRSLSALENFGEECHEVAEMENTFLFLKDSSKQLITLLNRTYPLVTKLPGVCNKLKGFDVLNFERTDEVLKHLLSAINKVFYFNEGGKLLNPMNRSFLNLGAIAKLLVNPSPIDELWLTQLLHCLIAKDYDKNTAFIQQTPTCLIGFSEKIVTELHGLSIDTSQKN
jgi:hypothetical protein